jgi:hypothetical protein
MSLNHSTVIFLRFDFLFDLLLLLLFDLVLLLLFFFNNF